MIDAARKAFPGLRAQLVSYDATFDHMIFETTGDTDAGSFWLVEVINRGEFGANEVSKSEPDYIVEGFSVVKMTPQGAPRYIVAGDKLIHHPDSDTAAGRGCSSERDV